MPLKDIFTKAEGVTEEVIQQVLIAEGYSPDLKQDVADLIAKHGPELLQLVGRIVLSKLVLHL